MNVLFHYLLIILIVLFLEAETRSNPAGAPVVLVPGDGGSQLEARLNKTTAVHVWCDKKTDWFALWLNLEELAPYVLDCWVDNMRLVINNKTGSTSNPPGVELRAPGLGNTSTIEWLDSSQLSVSSYFYPIANALVGWGYTRGLNIKGAPYDFRKAPNENQQYMEDLRKLIEKTSIENGRQPVVLIAHSMGSPYMVYLLNKQSQRWKDTFIKSYISLSGPWGGAVKTLRLFASGDNLGVFVVNPLTVRPGQRSWPSTAYLMPSYKYWNKDEIVIYSPKKNYTVNDYQSFFQDIKYPDGYALRKATGYLLNNLKAPNVEVHCLHGIKVKTPGALNYSASQWPDNQPTVITDDGDGTVNIRSLHGCLRWQKTQKQGVYHKEFPDTDHMQILRNVDVIAYIKKVVFS